ncbi:hypothetical protein MJK72_03875 [Klebsiella pneumoniae]|nr:hypothetical protein MJK72_03875 [Klebsiella pneumoniae]
MTRRSYREIGPFVASLHEWEDLEAFFEVYREKLVAILKQPASWKSHTGDADAYSEVIFATSWTYSRQRGELRGR